MLVLKRKPKETIYAILPDGTRIEIVAHSKAKLGLKGPPGVNFVRGEILAKIERSAAYLAAIERDTAEAISKPSTPDAA